MALTREQILTLTCLKKVDVPRVGTKKILAIGTNVESRGVNCDTYEDLADLMHGMKEKDINKVTLADLNAAYTYGRKIMEASAAEGIELIGYYDEIFPEQLRHTLNENGQIDPPLLLWCRGNIKLLKMPGLAVIGTREPTEEGYAGGKYLAAEFAKNGFNIVSGLAVGCDTCGHEGALEVGGKTTAILANGLDWNSIYPSENVELAQRIVEKGGLLLSEYSITNRVNRYALVARDRLQAGLALATLVVQTGEKGGTMHAANTTLISKKPLFTMKFKNPETNRHEKCLGNTLLAEKGAKFISGSDNIDALSKNILRTSYSI